MFDIYTEVITQFYRIALINLTQWPIVPAIRNLLKVSNLLFFVDKIEFYKRLRECTSIPLLKITESKYWAFDWILTKTFLLYTPAWNSTKKRVFSRWLAWTLKIFLTTVLQIFNAILVKVSAFMDENLREAWVNYRVVARRRNTSLCCFSQRFWLERL